MNIVTLCDEYGILYVHLSIKTSMTWISLQKEGFFFLVLFVIPITGMQIFILLGTEY
jgi:hypothetical protein